MEIATRHLTIDFGPTRAVEDLSLSFPLGTQMLFHGPSGGGKSTLLKALAGLVHSTQGEVLWNGRNRWSLKPREVREVQSLLGMVFQTDALFDALTVERNVALPLERRGLPASEVHQRVMQTLDRVGLAAAAAKRPEDLSGGMRKRVGIARALVTQPEVLFADDPLAGLDPETAAEIARLLKDVSAGRTFIAALPDPHPVLTFTQALRLTPVQRASEGQSAA